jgi:outer membrane protein assembly factor BamB
MAWACALLVALIGLGGCPACATRSPASPEPATPPASLFPAVQTWLRQLPSPPAADPAFDDSRIYVPLTSGELVALSRATGEVSWTADANTAWPPVATPDAVFAASTSQLLQFDAGSGTARQALTLPSGLAAPMSEADGRLLLPLASGVVQSVREGRPEWMRALGAAPVTPVSAADGAGYVALADGRVAALSLDTGAVRWMSEPLPGVLTRPVPSLDRVIVGSSDDVAYTLDAANGRIAWKIPTGGAVVGAAGTPERFFIAALDNIVRAVDRATGNQRWKYVTTTRAVSAPVTYRNLVLLHGNRPTLIALDSSSGEARGTFQLPEELNEPLLQGSPVVFGVPDGEDAPDGTTAAIVLKNGIVIGIGRPSAPAKDDAVKTGEEEPED